MCAATGSRDEAIGFLRRALACGYTSEIIDEPKIAVAEGHPEVAEIILEVKRESRKQ